MKLLGHRYYDSRTGRFISQDPAGDGDNWYAYCDNSPTNGDDPDGLSAISMGDGGSGDFGFRYDSEGSFGSSLWNGYEITTRERTREGEDGWTNNADGSMTWGNVWGPWGDWHVVNVPEIGGMGGGGAFAGRSGPERDPIDPDRGHGPQGTGNKEEKHTRTRSGDKGNQNIGARGYPTIPEGKRARERRLEQEAKKEAERNQRDIQFEVLRQGLAADAVVRSEELSFAEFLFAADEGAIAVGILVK